MKIHHFATSSLLAIGLAIVVSMPLDAFAQAVPNAPSPGQMTVIPAASHAASLPVRDFIPNTLPPQALEHFPLPETGPAAPGGGGGSGGGGGKGGGKDPLLQTAYPSLLLSSALVSFDGIAWNGGSPPDPNLAVGPAQVVEVVNTMFAIYDKSGNPITAPARISTIFSGMQASTCSQFNGGDPIVLYDQLAGRWLISQLEIPRPTNTVVNNHICIAVSTSSDAAGTYNLYDYDFGPTDLPDYPKFGVWPDAYYMSANTFRNGPFVGANACAFNRDAMLAGAPQPNAICFQGTTSRHSLLPSSLDGSTPPPPGSPNFFLQFDSNSLSLFKFHVDFVNPGLSTFTSGTSIPVGQFVQASFGSIIPQPNVPEMLEGLGDRLMYRLSYRNFGTYESLLVNHTVQTTIKGASIGQTGIRWYELRDPDGTPAVTQQSTFSPDTATWRWMGSLAQDKKGNILMGYSASSTTLFPSIRYTAHWAGLDPANQMEQEGQIVQGAGSQIPTPGGNGRNRWGDYTSVAVDPVDDCTMWFVSEYLPNTGYQNWITRVASFKFPNCQ